MLAKIPHDLMEALGVWMSPVDCYCLGRTRRDWDFVIPRGLSLDALKTAILENSPGQLQLLAPSALCRLNYRQRQRLVVRALAAGGHARLDVVFNSWDRKPPLSHSYGLDLQCALLGDYEALHWLRAQCYDFWWSWCALFLIIGFLCSSRPFSPRACWSVGRLFLGATLGDQRLCG